MSHPFLHRSLPSYLMCTLVGITVMLGACKKEQVKQGNDLIKQAKPVTSSERTEDGLIVRYYDDNNDGLAEITRYIEEVPDPDAPEDLIPVLKKMEIDLNSDGKINVTRHYGLTGKLERELVDKDLDGFPDAISYYDRGALAKKEILKPRTEEVEYIRYYAQNMLLRVEKDTTGDGKIDYWEYYEQGVLDRIGRDFNADGRADSWQRR